MKKGIANNCKNQIANNQGKRKAHTRKEWAENFINSSVDLSGVCQAHCLSE
jgi:hypothetical protein